MKYARQKKKKNTVWSHLYAESQKIKLIETKDKSVVTRGGGSGRGWAKWVKVVKGDKIAVIRWISSGDVMHSMVTVVNITVLYILKLLRGGGGGGLITRKNMVATWSDRF